MDIIPHYAHLSNEIECHPHRSHYRLVWTHHSKVFLPTEKCDLSVWRFVFVRWSFFCFPMYVRGFNENEMHICIAWCVRSGSTDGRARGFLIGGHAFQPLYSYDDYLRFWLYLSHLQDLRFFNLVWWNSHFLKHEMARCDVCVRSTWVLACIEHV